MILIDNQDCWIGIGLSLQANAGDVGDGISVGTGISCRHGSTVVRWAR